MPAKAHQTNLITLLVGVEQQRHDGALGRHHAVARSHRATGIHWEENEAPGPGFTDLLAQVRGVEGQPSFAAAPTVWQLRCGGAQRGIERDVMHPPLGQAAGHIVARATAQRAVAFPQRPRLRLLSQRAFERTYRKRLADTRPFVFPGQAPRMWSVIVFCTLWRLGLRASCGRRRRRRGRIATLGRAMPFEAFLQLPLIHRWLVKRLPTPPMEQDQLRYSAYVVLAHLCAPFI